jgi:sugar phosphate isomerase/epimerase
MCRALYNSKRFSENFGLGYKFGLYNVKELLEAINEAEYEIIEAFEEGEVIYDDGLWREMLKTYEEVKEKLKIRRYKTGWRIHSKDLS